MNMKLEIDQTISMRVLVSDLNSSFIEKFTALENLKFFGSLYDCKLIPAEQLLEMVGLSQHANKKVAGFSKGMKSRLNFARSIIHQPKVLFLDEPTSGFRPLKLPSDEKHYS